MESRRERSTIDAMVRAFNKVQEAWAGGKLLAIWLMDMMRVLQPHQQKLFTAIHRGYWHRQRPDVMNRVIDVGKNSQTGC